METFNIYLDGLLVDVSDNVNIHQSKLDWYISRGYNPTEERIKRNGN